MRLRCLLSYQQQLFNAHPVLGGCQNKSSVPDPLSSREGLASETMSQRTEKDLPQSRHYRNERNECGIHSLQTNIQAGQQNAGDSILVLMHLLLTTHGVYIRDGKLGVGDQL